MSYIGLVLGFVWGVFLAVFLQFNPLGQFLARCRTWMTVVVGIGGDLLIALWAIYQPEVQTPERAWEVVALIVVMSGLPMMARSLINEHRETRMLLDGYTYEVGQQDDLGAGGHNSSLS